MSAEVERLFSSAKLIIPPVRNGLDAESIETGGSVLGAFGLMELSRVLFSLTQKLSI